MKKVVIIGAGIGGLATANLLAAMGYSVEIHEKTSQPGGRAGRMQIDGFTFDTGPSWYLMPQVFEQYFRLLGEDASTLLQLKQIGPAYKIMFEDRKDSVVVDADLERDSKTFESIEPGAGRALKKYLRNAERAYNIAISQFLYTNFERPTSVINPSVAAATPRLLQGLFKPIHTYVSSYFKDERLQQIMEYPMVFLGTSPFTAPSMYSLMSHLDFQQGVFYPQGGIYTIIEKLVEIAKKKQVQIHYDSPVAKILHVDGRAVGLELQSGKRVDADIVISDADLHHTETQLVDDTHQTYPERYWKKREPGPSAILLYLGVRGTLPELEHHNLIFAKDWRANFEDIYARKQWSNPASLYICMPSKNDASVAPKNHENLFVLVPGPATTEHDDSTIAALADSYIDQIATQIGVTDLRKRIVVKHVVGPRHFADMFNSWNGTALGLSHVLKQSAFFRPKNKSRKISGLYYVGANTVPGIGLPMCLIGAELVVKRLSNDKSSTPLKTLPRLGDD